MQKFVMALCAACALFAFTGCGSVVPPGRLVLLVKSSGETEIVRQGVFRAWGRTKAYYVDQKLMSFSESDLKILCADNINLENVEIKAVLGFDIDDTSPGAEERLRFIKEKIPTVPVDELGIDGELSLENFYKMVVGDLLVNTARAAISLEETENVRGRRADIEKDIQARFTERCAALKYPLLVSAVLLNNIDFPEEVTTRRKEVAAAKLQDEIDAAQAEAAIAKAERQVAVETEEAKSRLVRAQAQADENRIMTESLTPEFLQWRQFEVLENLTDSLAKGPNNTVFMMPYHMMTPDMLNTAMTRDAIDDLKKPVPPTAPAAKP